MLFPYGYIIKTEDPLNSFIVYGEIKRCKQSYVSKGFRLYAPNLTHAGNQLKNDLYQALSGFLLRTNSNKRLQFKFERDSNYNDMLNFYEKETREHAQDAPYCKYVREKIAAGLREKIKNKELQREYLYLYISLPITEFMPQNFTLEHPEIFESNVTGFYETELINLRQTFGFVVEPLDHIDLYGHYYRSVNKSAIENQEIDYAKSYTDRLNEIYLNDYMGTSESLTRKNVCFIGDGYYHNILTLSDFPSFPLFPFYGNRFFEASIANLTITVNLCPQETRDVIKAKQTHVKRLEMDVRDNPSEYALAAEANMEKENIERMGKGLDKPFKCEFILHIWNEDLDQLLRDTSLIRHIAVNLQAPLYMHELGTQSLDTFLKTFPGNLYYKKWGDSLDTLHRSLAAMIPFNSSFVGAPEFQAIFDGDHKNLVGISPFLGGTPQHFAMFGQSGSGKSVDILGNLAQICCYYKKIVIIEEGASYLMFTRIVGGQYIEIDANSNLTLNYFDTCGTPLTAQQVEFAVNFLTAMCGQSNDMDKMQERAAIISCYVAKAYQTAYEEWRQKNPKLMTEIGRIAMTIDHVLPSQPMSRNTALDTYFDIKESLKKSPENRTSFDNYILDYYSSLDLYLINEYIIQNGDLLRDVAYAYMTREEMPYHSQLVEMIRSTPEPYHQREDTDRIATLLAQYSIESGQSTMFDGPTNIDLSNPVLHFELGKMGSASPIFKSMVGLVINNQVKNLIMNMPRSLMKLYLFEEAQRIMVVLPSGDLLMKQTYAQMRKYECVAGTITQEAGQLAESNVGNLIMGQSRQYFFLKNKDKQNLDYFSQFARISEETKRTIMEFPSPDAIQGRKYSSFVYYVDNGAYPIIGVVRFYATELDIAVASTSGKTFTDREEELRRLEIAYPEKSYLELIMLYLERKKINNNAYLLVCQMIKNKTLDQIEQLKEAIIDLSLKK